MMIRTLRILFFVLASIIEVEVRAGMVALPNQEEPFQEPADCILKESQCAMKTAPGKKYRTQIGTAEALLGPDSIMVRVDAKSLLLVSGEVWVNAENVFTVKTEYGDMRVDGGQILATRNEKSVLVRNLKGITTVLSRKRSEELSLNEGFEVRLSGVGEKGVGSLSIPTVIDFRDHLRRWAKIFSGTKKDFKTEILKLDAVVRVAAEQSSGLHQEIITRQIASDKVESDRETERRLREQQEAARMRALFRERANR